MKLNVLVVGDRPLTKGYIELHKQSYLDKGWECYEKKIHQGEGTEHTEESFFYTIGKYSRIR